MISYEIICFYIYMITHNNLAEIARLRIRKNTILLFPNNKTAKEAQYREQEKS